MTVGTRRQVTGPGFSSLHNPVVSKPLGLIFLLTSDTTEQHHYALRGRSCCLSSNEHVLALHCTPHKRLRWLLPRAHLVLTQLYVTDTITPLNRGSGRRWGGSEVGSGFTTARALIGGRQDSRAALTLKPKPLLPQLLCLFCLD